METNHFIMFCDIIPFPRFVQMLDLGLMPLFKLQDFLLRNLEAPHVSHFQLLKSHSSLSLDVTADFHCTLHVLYLAGLSGLRLDADTGLCRVHFENSLDESSVQYYLQSAGEFRRTGVFHQVSMRPQASPKSPGRRDSWTSGGSTRDAEEEVSEMMACRWLQRHQQYYKQQMLEMVDVEAREKEVQGFMIVHEDSLTSYKPVVYPNLVRFNEEVDGELGLISQ